MAKVSMKKIYLATPYSHPMQNIRRDRFNEVNIVAGYLMRQGFLVFSPISHAHPIIEAGDLPKGWELWSEYDLTFIEWADEIFVLRQDGWEESVGVTAEIKLAKKLNKPVKYLSLAEFEELNP